MPQNSSFRFWLVGLLEWQQGADAEVYKKGMQGDGRAWVTMAEAQKIVEYKTVTVAWHPWGNAIDGIAFRDPRELGYTDDQVDSILEASKAKKLPGDYRGYQYTSPLDEAINLLLVQVHS
jgi:hypothetical protein